MKLRDANGQEIDAEVTRTLTTKGEDWTIESRGGGPSNPRNPGYASAFLLILELAREQRLVLDRAYLDTLQGPAAGLPLKDRIIPTDHTYPVVLTRVTDLDALRKDIVGHGAKICRANGSGGNPNRRITIEFSR